jgi:ABC-type polysaccharide/polyol phosphate export permease
MRTLQALYRYRELLYMITWREIKIKYKQSVMGMLWAILMPMLVISAGILVRLGLSKLSATPLDFKQVTSVCVKALPWAFFIASIRFATQSLTANTNLVTKLYFPREVFPLSSILSQLFDFLIASLVLIVFLIFAQVGWSIHLLWVPLLIAFLILLTAGFGILLSAANLFFRDVKYLVEVFVTFAIFFTPVFYEADIAGRWEWLLLLNPVAPILEGLRSCIVLHEAPGLPWIAYSAIISVLLLLGSFAMFKTLEPKFAESI